MNDTVRFHVVVSGIVQGVCYRAFVQENAREIGVTGWVRNLPDGRVEAELEGDPALVDQLIEAMRQGPRMAQVTNLTSIALPAENRYADFRVRG